MYGLSRLNSVSSHVKLISLPGKLLIKCGRGMPDLSTQKSITLRSWPRTSSTNPRTCSHKASTCLAENLKAVSSSSTDSCNFLYFGSCEPALSRIAFISLLALRITAKRFSTSSFSLAKASAEMAAAFAPSSSSSSSSSTSTSSSSTASAAIVSTIPMSLSIKPSTKSSTLISSFSTCSTIANN